MPIAHIQAHFVAPTPTDNPATAAQREELLMYLENRKGEERLQRFQQETKLRAKAPGGFVCPWKQQQLEKDLRRKALLDRQKQLRKAVAAKPEPPAPRREKVVVLGAYNTSSGDAGPAKQPELPDAAPQGRAGSLLGSLRRESAEAAGRPQTGFKPQHSNDVAVKLGDKHEVIFTDNKSVLHADERYRDLRSKMKR